MKFFQVVLRVPVQLELVGEANEDGEVTIVDVLRVVYPPALCDVIDSLTDDDLEMIDRAYEDTN